MHYLHPILKTFFFRFHHIFWMMYRIPIMKFNKNDISFMISFLYHKILGECIHQLRRYTFFLSCEHFGNANARNLMGASKSPARNFLLSLFSLWGPVFFFNNRWLLNDLANVQWGIIFCIIPIFYYSNEHS